MLFFEHLALILGLLSTFGGAIAVYRSNVKKSYAAERDFAHLRKNYEQLSSAVGELDDRLGSICHELIEIKSALYVSLHKNSDAQK